MTPYRQAQQVYEREWCARSFREDVELHHEHGFVYSTPSFFVMGRPVAIGAGEDVILQPYLTFARELCDCWHIYLMAGDTARAWDILPFELPFISFQRRNSLKIWQLAQIRQRLGGHSTHSTT